MILFHANDRQVLNSLMRPLPVKDGIKPTVLHPHKTSVAQENLKFYQMLSKEGEQMYTAVDSHPSESKRLDQSIPANQ